VTKRCLGCQVEKDFADYYTFKDKWSGRQYYSSRCRPCHNLYKHTNANTPKNRKSEKLKARYKLRYDRWQEIRKQQNFACMICGVTEETLGRKLDVDHCHATDVVRGVLCNPCNTLLGHARDSIATLENAAKYLKDNAKGYKS
jgi:hypothetical protein